MQRVPGVPCSMAARWSLIGDPPATFAAGPALVLAIPVSGRSRALRRSPRRSHLSEACSHLPRSTSPETPSPLEVNAMGLTTQPAARLRPDAKAASLTLKILARLFGDGPRHFTVRLWD